MDTLLQPLHMQGEYGIETKWFGSDLVHGPHNFPDCVKWLAYFESLSDCNITAVKCGNRTLEGPELARLSHESYGIVTDAVSRGEFLSTSDFCVLTDKNPTCPLPRGDSLSLACGLLIARHALHSAYERLTYARSVGAINDGQRRGRILALFFPFYARYFAGCIEDIAVLFQLQNNAATILWDRFAGDALRLYCGAKAFGAHLEMLLKETPGEIPDDELASFIKSFFLSNDAEFQAIGFLNADLATLQVFGVHLEALAHEFGLSLPLGPEAFRNLAVTIYSDDICGSAGNPPKSNWYPNQLRSSLRFHLALGRLLACHPLPMTFPAVGDPLWKPSFFGNDKQRLWGENL